MTNRTMIAPVVLRPGVRQFKVETQSSSYTLVIHDKKGRYSAFLHGALSGGRGEIEVHDDAAEIGERSLFDTPPSAWLGQSLRVGSITTSMIRSVLDLDTGAIMRAVHASLPIEDLTSPGRSPSERNGRTTSAIQAMEQELAKARQENERLKRTSMKVSDKGGVSVYGLGRWPVTLYKNQWLLLLKYEQEIRAFIRANEHRLKRR